MNIEISIAILGASISILTAVFSMLRVSNRVQAERHLYLAIARMRLEKQNLDRLMQARNRVVHGESIDDETKQALLAVIHRAASDLNESERIQINGAVNQKSMIGRIRYLQKILEDNPIFKGNVEKQASV